MRAEKRKCPYCDTLFYSGDMCVNCSKKKPKVHELWLVCQDIKKYFESEVQTDDR